MGPEVRRCVILLAAASGCLEAAVTVRPYGPFRVEGARLEDARGRVFPIRGTELPEFRAGATAGGPYTPFSGTTLSGIRRRWNFNTVRIPVDATDLEQRPAAWSELERVVREANELELLVILSADSTSNTLWKQCAAAFSAKRNVLLEAPVAMVAIARAAGVKYAMLAPGETADVNTATEVRPAEGGSFGAMDRARAAEVAARRPVIASGFDLPLNRAEADCEAIPRDPAEAERMVEENLAFFDAHGISWIAPRFSPGELLGNYWSQDATTLENGWGCGADGSGSAAGIGEAVRFRLWGGNIRGLFIVNGGGGMAIPRGSIAIGYGPVLAERDEQGRGARLPVKLGGVEVRVTDRLGVMRRARILYASAGWGQVNFIVPEGSAAGPARVAVTREDGSASEAAATIVDFEPSLWSAYGTGFGPAVGFVTQTDANGKTKEFPVFQCTKTDCRTAPIPLSKGVRTVMRLHATGLPHGGDISGVRMSIGGVTAKVLSMGPSGDAGNDDLTVELPVSMRGLGETDVVCSVNGRLANVVRVNLGNGHN